MSNNETFFHYCNGTWIKGFVLQCRLADEHKVKLVQSARDLDKARFRLGKAGQV